jgi:nitrite reductase/ring-hydroxylating ferredoxin subunit
MTERVLAGTFEELRATGYLLIGTRQLPIAVFLDEDEEPRALDDRCPHLGSLLHLGEVRDGAVECHWHRAHFVLKTGCSLDPFADDVPTFPVEVEGESIFVVVGP